MHICIVPNCNGKHKGYGYCDKHYQRYKKRGTIDGFASRENHGLGDTPEYEAWIGMKKRCYNKSTRNYKNYGGRGIKVCEQWITSFTAFLANIGPRPSPLYSIDRIDNNGDYEPTNVRWATKQQQAINRRQVGSNQYRGISWTPKLNKWTAKIKSDKKLVHLGVFIDEEQAALAYDIAAIQIFGYDAVLNFPSRNAVPTKEIG